MENLINQVDQMMISWEASTAVAEKITEAGGMEEQEKDPELIL